MGFKKWVFGAVMAAGGAALLGGACGPQMTATPLVKLVPVTAALGATITVSASESSALAGTSLVIPPGALAQDTIVTLQLSQDQLSAEAAGPVAVWGPAGLAFRTSVKMTLPFTDSWNASDLMVSAVDLTSVNSTELTVDSANHEVEFSIDRLGEFQVARRHRPDGGHRSDGGHPSDGGQASDGGFGSDGGCDPRFECCDPFGCGSDGGQPSDGGFESDGGCDPRFECCDPFGCGSDGGFGSDGGS